MNYLPITLALSFILTSTLFAQSAPSHDAVSKYVDQDTVAIGWIDIAKADVDDLASVLGEIMPNRSGEEYLQQIKKLREALVQTQVDRIYTLFSLATLTQGPEALVVPSSNGKAVSLLLETLTQKFTFAEDGDCVIGAKPEQLAKLKLHPNHTSPKLREAIRSIDGSMGVALAPPPLMVATLIDAMKETPTTGVESLAAIHWLSLSAELPLGKMRLQLKTESNESAKRVAQFADSFVAKRLKDSKHQLTASVINDSVVYASNSREELVNKLRMVDTLVTGGSQKQAPNSLKMIGLALHNFASDHQNGLPPQCLVDANGKRLLSWRVLILPYLDQQALYDRFHLNEPWDSPHNLALAKSIPPVYVSTNKANRDSWKTEMLGVITKDSVLGRPGKALHFQDIKDGSSNTIWLVKADASKAVVWTKPEDLVVNTDDPWSSLDPKKETGFWSSFMDGSARFIGSKTPAAVLNALFSVDGKEEVEYDQIK